MQQVDDNFTAEPLRSRPGRVPAEWIDYNGHMNVAYYTLAFDKAVDEVLDERLGIGPEFVRESGMGPMALQTSINYLDELVEGDGFFCELLLLDTDPKRIHFIATMVKQATGTPAATYESLAMNVDLAARRAAPYPDWAQARLSRLCALHATLPRPAQVGATIGIRRWG